MQCTLPSPKCSWSRLPVYRQQKQRVVDGQRYQDAHLRHTVVDSDGRRLHTPRGKLPPPPPPPVTRPVDPSSDLQWSSEEAAHLGGLRTMNDGTNDSIVICVAMMYTRANDSATLKPMQHSVTSSSRTDRTTMARMMNATGSTMPSMRPRSCSTLDVISCRHGAAILACVNAKCGNSTWWGARHQATRCEVITQLAYPHVCGDARQVKDVVGVLGGHATDGVTEVSREVLRHHVRQTGLDHNTAIEQGRKVVGLGDGRRGVGRGQA